jgi:predicted PurR-regulated permease PerM
MSDPIAPVETAVGRFFKRWGFLLFIVLIVWMFSGVLLPFLFALLVAYILAPIVARMARIRLGQKTMPRGVAVLCCYVVTIGILALFFSAFLPRLSHELARLGDEGPHLWERIDEDWTPRLASYLEEQFPTLKAKPVPVEVAPHQQMMPQGTLLTLAPLGGGEYAVIAAGAGLELEKVNDKRFRLVPPSQEGPPSLEEQLRLQIRKVLAGLANQADDLLRVGRRLVTSLVGGMMRLVLVLMVAAFILIDLKGIHGFVRGIVPLRYRDDYDLIVAGVDRGLGGVIRGQLIICVINGVLTCIGMLIFGVKYAVLLSVVAALLSLIPIFGSILSTVPIVIVALVSGDSGLDIAKGALMLVWILGIHFVEANILNPKIIGTSAKMSPIVVIFALIAGEHSFGLVGAVFAVPVASIIQTLFMYFRGQAWRTHTAERPPTGI